MYEIMWKNIEEPESPQGKYGACAFHAEYLRLQTHTPGIGNVYCFSTATMITRTPLKVTSYVHCLSFICT